MLKSATFTGTILLPVICSAPILTQLTGAGHLPTGLAPDAAGTLTLPNISSSLIRPSVVTGLALYGATTLGAPPRQALARLSFRTSKSKFRRRAHIIDADTNNSPGAFAPVYWSIKALKVYQNNGQNNAKREGEGDAEADATEFSERTAEPEPVAKAEAAPEPTPFVAAAEQMGKRAYGSQVAPSSVAKASQTVNSVSASVAASKEATSLGLPPPSPVPKTSMAANQQRDVIGESRRARYMPRNVQA